MLKKINDRIYFKYSTIISYNSFCIITEINTKKINKENKVNKGGG